MSEIRKANGATEMLADRLVDQMWNPATNLSARAVRAFALVPVAVWLSLIQKHTYYSTFTIALLVFSLAIFNRLTWAAGVVILFLAGLYLVPPEMVAAIKATR